MCGTLMSNETSHLCPATWPYCSSNRRNFTKICKGNFQRFILILRFLSFLYSPSLPNLNPRWGPAARRFHPSSCHRIPASFPLGPNAWAVWVHMAHPRWSTGESTAKCRDERPAAVPTGLWRLHGSCEGHSLRIHTWVAEWGQNGK